jgi:type VI secretion system protein ImpF
MAKSSPSTDSEGPIGDRLQPALLDRLTDDEPTKATEAVDAAAMTRSRLRRAVLRDIAWILNTTNMESDTALESFPHARQSVVNFGVETLSGRRIADLDWHQLEQSIKDAVLTFEPRVLPHTLEVRVLTTVAGMHHHNVLAFEIRGQLWSLPYPMELVLRTNLDVESGHVVLFEQPVSSKS